MTTSPLPGTALGLAKGFRGVDMVEPGTWPIPGPMLKSKCYCAIIAVASDLCPY